LKLIVIYLFLDNIRRNLINVYQTTLTSLRRGIHLIMMVVVTINIIRNYDHHNQVYTTTLTSLRRGIHLFMMVVVTYDVNRHPIQIYVLVIVECYHLNITHASRCLNLAHSSYF